MQQWLAEPRTEPFFPTADCKETSDAGVRWVEMALEQKSGLTAIYHGSPVAMGISFLQTYTRLVHQCVHILVVSQEYRRLGIGSELLEALEAQAKDYGVELFHVEVYDDPGVEAFYRKQGYIEFARQQGWSKDTSQHPPIYRARVCMEKFL